MSDKYDSIRSLPFPTIAGVLGIDINRYKARKSNTEWAGPCPITPQRRNKTSFSYSADGKFNCFSHSESGRGAIDLTMKVKGIGFQAAVDLLQPLTTAPIRAPDAQKPSETAPASATEELPSENPAKRFTYEKHFVPCVWLAARGFSPETLARYGVGLYDNPSRQSVYKGKVLIRMQRFTDGQVVGYLARDIRDEQERGQDPKYIMPPGIHKALEVFGAYQLKELAPIRVLYVVESPFAVLKVQQLGFPAIATYGWHVSEEQADIIAKLCRGVVWLPDRDKYAEAAAHLGVLARRVWVKMPELPEGVDDPEYLTAEQIKSLT